MMKEGNFTILYLVMLLTILTACSDEITSLSYIPNSIVDFEININTPEFFDLRRDRGHAFIAREGDRGIILYNDPDHGIQAFESNCSYLPDSSCANVMVDETGLFMVDTCCQSTFDFTGTPTSGPAVDLLFRYSINLSGDFLRISN